MRLLLLAFCTAVLGQTKSTSEINTAECEVHKAISKSLLQHSNPPFAHRSGASFPSSAEPSASVRQQSTKILSAQTAAILQSASVLSHQLLQSDTASVISMTAAAIAGSMMMCGDDVVWLLPFTAAKNWRTMVIAYVTAMEATVLISALLVNTAQDLQSRYPEAPLELLLQALSAILLTVYALLCYKDWLEEQKEDEEYNSVTEAADSEAHGKTVAHERRISDVFSISILGNLDNFAIYISMLLNGMVDLTTLALGVFITACIVVVIDLGAVQLQCIVDLAEKVPLFAILGGLALLTYFQVWSEYVSL